MPKSRKNKNPVIETITVTSNKAIPIVTSGFNTVGNVAKGVASTSIPIFQKGVSSVYGTLANGLDIGIKGVNNVAKGVGINKKRRTRRHKKRSYTKRKYSTRRRR